jgi:uncharacterized protein YggE
MRQKIIILFVLVFGLIGTASAAATDAARSTLTVAGEGIVEAIPDQAKINIGVNTQAAAIQSAQQQNSEAMAKVIGALKKNGITSENISTNSFSIYQQQVYPQNKRPEVVGYAVTNSVTVTINDLTQLGKIIDLCSAAGANEINEVRFICKHNGEYQQQALTTAYQNALDKGKTLAAASGRKLGQVISINEASARDGQSVNFAAMGLNKGGAGNTTPIETGSIQYRATITVEYDLAM